jgi:peptidoglycan/xylan/chitin deacetylase (PgdA/CDA1 family)
MRSLTWTAVAAALIAILTAAPVAKARQPWPSPALGDSRSGDPEVLFTFDDGPAPKRTAKVLDTLRDHGVYAIFFLVGRHLKGKEAESGKAMVDRMLAEGHMVGNHTVTHVHLCNGKADRADKEIDENAKLVEEVSGLPAVWFRAPYGDRCKRLIAQLEARHLHHVHWDIDPQEWKTHDANGAKNYVIRHLRNLQGRAVLLMHDIQPETVKALPGILAWIKEENVRREKKGQRPIRILDPADIALEHLAPETVPFLAQLASDFKGFTPDLVASLAGPVVKPTMPSPAPPADTHPASVLPKPNH